MSATINNLDFLSYKTEGAIAKEFKEQTGKSRTSAIFMAYMKELKEISEPTNFNTNKEWKEQSRGCELKRIDIFGGR